jgi:hypothetical protein
MMIEHICRYAIRPLQQGVVETDARVARHERRAGMRELPFRIGARAPTRTIARFRCLTTRGGSFCFIELRINNGYPNTLKVLQI